MTEYTPTVEPTEPAGTDPGPAPAPASPARPGDGPAGRPGLGWTELGTAVPLYLVLSAVAIIITGMPGPNGENTIPVLLGAATAGLLTVLIVLALRLVPAMVRALVARLPMLGMRATTWRWLLLGAGTGVLTRLLAFGLVLGYMALTGDTSNPQDFIAATAGAGGLGLVAIMLIGAVFVPFVEELLFRGVAYGALRRYGIWIALIASSILFGLAHGINVVLPVALVLGALNALLYERSGSIWPSMVAHGVHNALGFAFVALVGV